VRLFNAKLDHTPILFPPRTIPIKKLNFEDPFHWQVFQYRYVARRSFFALVNKPVLTPLTASFFCRSRSSFVEIVCHSVSSTSRIVEARLPALHPPSFFGSPSPTGAASCKPASARQITGNPLTHAGLLLPLVNFPLFAPAFSLQSGISPAFSLWPCVFAHGRPSLFLCIRVWQAF